MYALVADRGKFSPFGIDTRPKHQSKISNKTNSARFLAFGESMTKAPPQGKNYSPPHFRASDARHYIYPVYVYGSQDPTKVLNITGCRFLSNSVTTEDEDSWGGGVVALGGEISISNTVFSNNSGEDGYIYTIYLLYLLYIYDPISVYNDLL